MLSVFYEFVNSEYTQKKYFVVFIGYVVISIFERAKSALGVKTNKEMAERLGQAESSVSGWKSRDSIPIDYLVVISKLSNVSLDWIVKGDNSLVPPPKNAIAPYYRSDDAFDAVEEPTIAEQIDQVFEVGYDGFRKSEDYKSTYFVYSILDRLKSVFNVSNVVDLAGHLNVPVKTINRWINHGFIPYIFLFPIAEQTGVSLDWLILGKGEMHGGGMAAADGDAQLVPLYDVPVSAGHGSFFEAENVVQQVPFDAGWLRREGLHAKDLVCLPIAGDSMAPGLKAADIVLVNRARTGGDGVFVLRLGGVLRIKRLQWLADGRLRISSDNPVYEPEYVQPDDLADDFAVIGFCHTKIGRVD